MIQLNVYTVLHSSIPLVLQRFFSGNPIVILRDLNYHTEERSWKKDFVGVYLSSSEFPIPCILGILGIYTVKRLFPNICFIEFCLDLISCSRIRINLFHLFLRRITNHIYRDASLFSFKFQN